MGLLVCFGNQDKSVVGVQVGVQDKNTLQRDIDKFNKYVPVLVAFFFF